MFSDKDDPGGRNQFVDDDIRIQTKNPVVRGKFRKAKVGRRGEDLQFKEYFQTLAKTTNSDSVNIKGVGGGLKMAKEKEDDF
jgi:hypothetical protein